MREVRARPRQEQVLKNCYWGAVATEPKPHFRSRRPRLPGHGAVEEQSSRGRRPPAPSFRSSWRAAPVTGHLGAADRDGAGAVAAEGIGTRGGCHRPDPPPPNSILGRSLKRIDPARNPAKISEFRSDNAMAVVALPAYGGSTCSIRRPTRHDGPELPPPADAALVLIPSSDNPDRSVTFSPGASLKGRGEESRRSQ
jgi:hypothetical protein